MDGLDTLEKRVRESARRAGLSEVSPSAVAGFLAVAVLALAWGLWRWWPREAPAAELPVQTRQHAASSPGSDAQTSPAATETVFVHVVGAVRRPGVYGLASTSRVKDAVDAAGGVLPDAVVEGVNLARKVTDGEQIDVPDEDDRAAPGSAAGAVAAATGVSSGPVDINSADVAALDALPGVGPATAQRIVADREANGPFASIEDLQRVSGIGPKKLEQLSSLVCVR